MRQVVKAFVVMILVVTCLWTVPINTFAGNEVEVIDSGYCGAEGSNAAWQYDNQGVLTITGRGAINGYRSGRMTPWTSYNNDIRSVVVKNGITSIPSYTFEYAFNLESVSLPNSLEVLACNAFNDCQKLKEIVIPGSVTRFEPNCFFNRCYELTSIYYLGTEDEWALVENRSSCNAYDKYTNKYFLTLHDGKEATCIQDGMEPYYQFDGTEKTTIYSMDKNELSALPTIPAHHSFKETNRTEATCTEQGQIDYVCTVCGETKSETIEANGHFVTNEPATDPTCEYVGYKNGSYCVSCGQGIDDRETVPALGHDIVDGKCSRLKTIATGTCGENVNWRFDSHGVLTISGNGELDYYKSGNKTPWAAYNNDIRCVKIEHGITGIPSYSFEYMYHLESVALPDTLSHLACNAFNDCHRLKEVTIPDSVVRFEKWCFFNRCYKLESIYYLGTEEDWNAIENSNECISLDSRARVIFLGVPLKITSQPSDVLVKSGEKALFSIAASGNDLSYQWQYKGSGGSWKNCTSKTEGFNTASLKVEGTAGRNNYQYRCVVTDGNGKTVTSDAAALYVFAIRTHPSSIETEEGETVIFKVDATGNNLTYQWQYYNEAGGKWKNSGMIGAQTSEITVPALEKRNGQRYRCKVSDGVGNTITSKAATLTVKQNLAITVQPSDMVAEIGNDATFTIAAKGENLTYQWQYYSITKEKWTDSGMDGNQSPSVTVPVTEKRNGQKYRCIVTDGSGNRVVSKSVTLTAADPKLRILTQPTNQSGSAGDTVTFSVTAQGKGISYQWQYRAATSSVWKSSGMTGSTSNKVSVPVTEKRNGQSYRCIIADSSGNAVISDTATLTVK